MNTPYLIIALIIAFVLTIAFIVYGCCILAARLDDADEAESGVHRS